ncbi:MAG: 4Fe-4S binding protein [Promethearchaeota archaeon]
MTPQAMAPMFILWAAIILVTLVLLKRGKLSKKASLGLGVLSFLVGGIALGGTPNAVKPFDAIFSAIAARSFSQTIVLFGVVVIVLLVTVFLAGRVFCGHACPVGAIQEVASKVAFGSSVKERKATKKFRVEVPTRVARLVRWGVFGAFIVLAAIWSVAVLQIINPFSGLRFFTNPVVPALLIPFLWLVAIVVASFFVYRPWCRFMCPFGAVAGEVGRAARWKLVRTSACTDCGICEQVCPTQSAGRDSDKGECYLCGRCVEACPRDAIVFGKSSAASEPVSDKLNKV